MPKKQVADKIEEESVEVEEAGHLTAALKAARRKVKAAGEILVSEQENHNVGLEFYGLAEQYLYGMNALPLQSLVLLGGAKNSFKTTYMLALLSNFLKLAPTPGQAAVVNTEGKWSDTKQQAILQQLSDQLVLEHVASIESWQTFATEMLQGWREWVNKAPSKVVPLGIGIDSMTGSQSRMLREQVLAGGHGAKTFTDRAQVLTQWLDVWSSEIVGIPATVVLTTHIKTAIQTGFHTGPAQTIIPGGDSSLYHASVIIKMGRIKDVTRGGLTGTKIKFVTDKNSLAPDKRSIEVDVMTEFDPEGNQRQWWDWDSALVPLLLAIKDEPEYKERLASVVGVLKEGRGDNNRAVYTSEKLGMTRLTGEEMGKAMQGDLALRSQLQDALLIKRIPVWAPGYKFA